MSNSPHHPTYDPSQDDPVIVHQTLTQMGMEWQRLQDLSGGLEDFELELLGIFVEDTQAHVDAMKVAIADRNFVILAAEAHHVKGASANVGAVPMTTLANHIEQQAHNQTMLDLTAPLISLEEWLALLQRYVAASRPT